MSSRQEITPCNENILDLNAPVNFCNAPTAQSGQFELDLLFPQNDTYAPTSDFPIVFALQNPTLFQALGLSLTWTISSLASNSTEYDGTANLTSGLIPAANGNTSLVLSPTFESFQEGSWELYFSLDFDNCDNFLYCGLSIGLVQFTIQKGSQSPNLTYEAVDNCTNLPSAAFGVESSASPNGTGYVWAINETLSSTPCAVKINQTVQTDLEAVADCWELTNTCFYNSSAPHCPPPNCQDPSQAAKALHVSSAQRRVPANLPLTIALAFLVFGALS